MPLLCRHQALPAATQPHFRSVYQPAQRIGTPPHVFHSGAFIPGLHTPAGLSDENLQRTWNATLPAIQGPYDQQQHMDGTWLQAQDSSQSQWRRWAGILPPADHSYTEGPGSHPDSNYLVQHPQYGTQAPVRDSSGCFSPQQQRSELLLDTHDPNHWQQHRHEAPFAAAQAPYIPQPSLPWPNRTRPSFQQNFENGWNGHT